MYDKIRINKILCKLLQRWIYTMNEGYVWIYKYNCDKQRENGRWYFACIVIPPWVQINHKRVELQASFKKGARFFFEMMRGTSFCGFQNDHVGKNCVTIQSRLEYKALTEMSGLFLRIRCQQIRFLMTSTSVHNIKARLL